MLEIGTSGLMSGERKRAAQFLRADTAPFLDSTPPEVPQNERPADPPSPQPDPVSAPVAAFPVDNLGSASPISHDDAFPGRRNGSGPRLEPNQ
jgi:hypothetical protein